MVDEIKQKTEDQNLVEFDEIKSELAPKSGIETGFRLLGELLAFLRENKLMQELLICRQIQKIDIIDGVAEFSSSEDLSELFSNEVFKTELDNFFKEKNLSFKIKAKEKTISAEEELNKLLGGKLKIV